MTVEAHHTALTYLELLLEPTLAGSGSKFIVQIAGSLTGKKTPYYGEVNKYHGT